MNPELDEKLGQLLRGDAAPERDPMFRIRVLEHREEHRFQKRQRVLLAGAVFLAVLPAVGLLLAGKLVAYGPVVLLAVALAAAGVAATRGVRQAMHWLRAGSR